MSTIEDLFGAAPGRPADDPDFWRLSEILLALDGENDEGARSMVDDILTGRYCSTTPMVYVAQQRTMRVLASTGLPEQIQRMLMCIWTEGFIVGSEFRKRQQELPKDIFLTSVNEEGEVYDHHKTFEAAIKMLYDYPNDTVVMSYGGPITDD